MSDREYNSIEKSEIKLDDIQYELREVFLVEYMKN